MAVWVVLGAMVGAPARYLIDRAVAGRWDSALPLGTLSVNTAGSAMVGVLLGGPIPSWLYAVLGVGFCGALTTFSTFGYETVRLATDGAYRQALGNIGMNLACCLVAVYIAATLTQWLWPR